MKKNEIKSLNIADATNRFIKRTERGWAGHFIGADRCKFRRNTLVEYNDIAIVVSTVGLLQWECDRDFETLSTNRYFETIAFHTDKDDKRYKDIDVSKQVYFDSKWEINEIDANDKANKMHETVVSEIMKKLLKGCKFEVTGS